MFRRVAVYLEMIKVAHTVFALPFALMGMFLAARELGRPWALPDGRTILFVLLAMVGGRSAAMGFNRIVDARIDALNPRTRSRAIPAGEVSRGSAALLVGASVALLAFASAMLNPLCLALSPVLVAILFAYSYAKRFTWAAHLVLGLCLGIAPLAAWLAVTGSFDPRILLLTFAVLFWTAGFDILYALQDMEFDRRQGLHSIPRYLGVRGSLRTARIFHAIMAVLLLVGYHGFRLGGWYLAGVAVSVAALAYEHAILSEDDLSRLGVAFFNLNGFVSIALCLFTWLDLAI